MNTKEEEMEETRKENNDTMRVATESRRLAWSIGRPNQRRKKGIIKKRGNKKKQEEKERTEEGKIHQWPPKQKRSEERGEEGERLEFAFQFPFVFFSFLVSLHLLDGGVGGWWFSLVVLGFLFVVVAVVVSLFLLNVLLFFLPFLYFLFLSCLCLLVLVDWRFYCMCVLIFPVPFSLAFSVRSWSYLIIHLYLVFVYE